MIVLAMRFILTQSWWLACQLIRRHPKILIVETHPGGGQYDCLTLIHNGQSVIDINRAGSIHVKNSSDSKPVTFEDLFVHDDSGEVVTAIERAAGMSSPSSAPPSTPAVLTYRVLAQLMAITLNEKHRWDVRNERLDSSGMGGGAARGYLADYPVAAARAREKRPDDLLGDPLYRYWGVLRDGKPVAVLDTDGFAYVAQQVLYLPEIYSASSRRLTPLMAATLGPLLP
ncbi:hypothetical protein KZ829_36680 [Actinoplanes hulinensis]|uniref:T3SS peptide-binding chaperone domain-containing protein n=1 Tax=Actinoplanes hulinensis TaxID=1144547 RepID=A0ABS7BEH1_9ACTN|nr:hypothetical protein [Actinoplanes hulinensis]MBW6439263.1 hypothetical protein [Actinoplanes hulinensis]MBW6439274.1 hypothetical protein [Actinoplanes hulinensis]